MSLYFIQRDRSSILSMLSKETYTGLIYRFICKTNIFFFFQFNPNHTHPDTPGIFHIHYLKVIQESYMPTSQEISTDLPHLPLRSYPERIKKLNSPSRHCHSRFFYFEYGFHIFFKSVFEKTIVTCVIFSSMFVWG